MAEIIVNGKGKGAKKLSRRIDLTPMVDLGFILITFFLFTTTLLKTNTMEVNMPVDGPPNEVPDHVAFKLFLGKQHQWYILKGRDAMQNNFSVAEKIDSKNLYAFRKLIRGFRDEIKTAVLSGRKGTHPGDDLMVLIKPLPGSDFGDMVNALDEMNISGVQRYAVVDIDDKEKIETNRLNL